MPFKDYTWEKKDTGIKYMALAITIGKAAMLFLVALVTAYH